MSCERYRPAIAAHAAGDTIAGAASQHLGSCAACRRRLETGRQLLAEVDAELRHTLAPGASPEFAPRVIASVDTGSASRSRRWLPAAWAGFAAAAAIAAVVLFRHGAADPGAVPVPDFRLNAEATRDFQRHAPATRRRTNGADIRLSAEVVPDNTPRPAAASGFRRKPSAPHQRRITRADPPVVVEPARALAIARLSELVTQGVLKEEMLPPPVTPDTAVAELTIAPLEVAAIPVPDVEIVSRPPAVPHERQ